MHSFSAEWPATECFVRAEAFYDGREHHGKAIRGVMDRINSQPGEALSFSGWLANGAMWDEIPINMITLEAEECDGTLAGHPSESVFAVDDTPPQLAELQLWNCFEYEFVVEERSSRALRKIEYRLEGEWITCDYTGLTINWPQIQTLGRYGEVGHKCAHILVRPDGYLAAQPNNRCRFLDPATVTEPFDSEDMPGYRTRTEWPWQRSVEARMFSAGDGYLYRVNARKAGHGAPAPPGSGEPWCKPIAEEMARVLAQPVPPAIIGEFCALQNSAMTGQNLSSILGRNHSTAPDAFDRFAAKIRDGYLRSAAKI